MWLVSTDSTPISCEAQSNDPTCSAIADYAGLPADRFPQGYRRSGALCKRELQEDPFSGTLFVFRNRRGTALKLLVYDGLGFWLVTRRFSEGRIRWWPKTQDATLHPIRRSNFPFFFITAYQSKLGLLLPGANFLRLFKPLPLHFPCSSRADTGAGCVAHLIYCE